MVLPNAMGNWFKPPREEEASSQPPRLKLVAPSVIPKVKVGYVGDHVHVHVASGPRSVFAKQVFLDHFGVTRVDNSI